MKNLEELAWSSTNIEAIQIKVIASEIERVARDKRILVDWYKVNRDLVGDGKPESIAFPRSYAGIAFSIGVGYLGTVAASESTYDATTFTVTKIGGRLQIPNEVIRRTQRDVIADQLYEAGEVYAETLDVMALEAMFPAATTTPTGASTFGVGKSIIGIKSVTGSNLSSIAPYEGSMVVTGAETITYWYVPNTCAGTVDAGATLDAKDILQARNKVLAQKYNPDALALHQDLLPDLWWDANLKFLDRSAYTGDEVIRNAEMGKFFGLKGQVSNRLPKYGAIVADTNKLGRYVIKRDLEIHREEKWDVDAIYFYLWAEATIGVLNTGAYAAAVKSGWMAY